MAIATTAEYKTYAGIGVTTYDARLDVLIPAVQQMIEGYTGRLFDTATFTEYLDGHDTDVLTVRNPPIASITSITSYATPTDTGVVLDSSLYTFNTDESGVIRFQPSGFDQTNWGRFDSEQDESYRRFRQSPQFWRGFRNWKVIYVGGYGSSPAAATMPLKLKLALYKLVTIELNTTGSDLTLKSENLGSYSYDRGQLIGTAGMNQALKDLCFQFKHRGFSL